MHKFLPSKRTVWTVVGREEHWLDHNLEYCSCQKFYFDSGELCYHLICQQQAVKVGKYQKIEFSDDEFDGFITGLVEGILT